MFRLSPTLAILALFATMWNHTIHSCTFAQAGSSGRPNIVFIFIDDMGFADPSCFGNPLVKTPNIDQLAADGIKLTNFYVNSPICSPSRVAVTTGQYPQRWKIHSYLNSRANNEKRGMRDYLDSAAPTTAKKLKAAGYATAHFGKWHMGGGRDVDDAPLPTEYGFDESLVAFEGLGDRLLDNPKNASVKLGRGNIEFCERWQKTEKYTDRAIDFIRRHKEEPFYVRLFPNDVHDAHVPWPGSDEKWKAVTDNRWEQLFFAVLEELDKQIGRLVAEIDALGLSEKTLIVFTSDNGPTDWPKYYRQPGDAPPGFTGPFFGRKWSLFEGGIRMPFIARWKGTIPSGVTDTESLMCAIDLSPTFCSLADVSVPAEEKLDGVDRCSVLLGKPSERGRPIFWQYGAPHAVLKPGNPEFESPSFAVRDGKWKLLINPDGSAGRLFNLVDDPGEQTNLFEQQPERVETLRRELGTWANEMGLAFDGQAEPKVAASVRGTGDKQAAPDGTEGLVRIFDGRSLNGWHAAPSDGASDWWVEDGVIVGKGSKNRQCYLVWQDDQLDDFILEFKYRLPGEGNTGVEIRSKPDVTGKRPFEGYHADLGHVGIGPHILGAWDFHFAQGAEPPCPRGTRLMIDSQGVLHPSSIANPLTVKHIREHDWNKVRVISKGSQFQFFVNGKLASEFTDYARLRRLDQGAIGLQIHDKGMTVHFEDVRLQRLPKSLFGKLSERERDTLRIAENVLIYQRDWGGWPKNYDRRADLTEASHIAIAAEKSNDDATIDNQATHSEIRLLTDAFRISHDDRFRLAALKGIRYLLDGQYDHGGWPQVFPNPGGYASHITFNDNAMVGVLRLLQDVSRGGDYAYVPEALRQRAAQAVKRGVECILKCQILQDGVPTVWCAQHDEKSFLPAQARSYELPSLSGSESVGIVRFLMQLEQQSPEVVAAIEGAVSWFEKVKLPGIKVVQAKDPSAAKGYDRIVVEDSTAAPMWARFYDLKTNQPFFCSRDGIPRSSLAEISYERRNGYSWLGYYAQDLLDKDLPAWRERVKEYCVKE